MYEHRVNLRVRYAETDKMGYCYYGNYATYFEVARVEALRDLGFPYKELEDQGVLLPVVEYSIKYLKPAFYDEMLTVVVKIEEIPSVKIKFTYETFNSKDEKLNFGNTVLVFLDQKSGKPQKSPEELINKLRKYIK